MLALASTSLLLGASPGEGGPAVGHAPATLHPDLGGDPLVTLAASTPLAITSAACEQGVPWLDVAVDDRVGWVMASQVDLGNGVPLALPAWSSQLVVRDQPQGQVQAVLPAATPITALEVGCVQYRAWLRVVAGGMSGWVAGQDVLFRPPPSSQGLGAAAIPAGSTAVATAPATLPPTASPDYGVDVFLWGRPDAQAWLDRLRDLRFTWQKSLIRWRDVEGAGKGHFDWASTDALLQASAAAGLRVLARVDFQPDWARKDGANDGPPDNAQDYVDFLKALVGRYKSGSPYGHLDAVEVWNEPNLTKTWGNQPINRRQAADYVRLLSLAYSAIKSIDPSVVVVSAALSPTGTNTSSARPDDLYLQWLYDAGLRGHYDALGVHAPGFRSPPELSPAEAAANPFWGGDRSFAFRRVEDLRAIMARNGDAAKQVWVTEFGWTSDPIHPDYSWYQVSETEKADYLVRAFAWARSHWSPWIGPMFVWNLPDPTWDQHDEKYWWAITEPDGSPRPAFNALREARSNGTLP